MKILLAVNDSSASRVAAQFIASHTALLGAPAEIVLINVQWPLSRQASAAIGTRKVRAIYRHDADQALRPVQRLLAAAGIKAPARIALGAAGECIAAAADKIKADLIVMGARGLGAFKGMLFGSVTNAVLARTQVPMLVLRERSGAAAFGESPHIGIAVDGSRFGKAAVRWTIRHRALFGASPRFTVIHVVPDFLPMITGPEPPPVVWTDEEIRAMQDAAFAHALTPAREKLTAARLDVDEARLIGAAGDRIAEFARKQKLDLLVLGSHGYGAFKGAVLGSVATRVAARCDTPLLLIRRG
jgi:nucleotide-binding universal stress UspA family protein